jgi:hypothetical protein
MKYGITSSSGDASAGSIDSIKAFSSLLSSAVGNSETGNASAAHFRGEN